MRSRSSRRRRGGGGEGKRGKHEVSGEEWIRIHEAE